MRVGITGGIGSGKTTVCGFFSALGVPVYDADAAAKRLIEQDKALRQEMIRLLGEDTYLPDGSYNRKYVAGIVFGDREKLEKLNALVHPVVERDSMRWHENQIAGGHPYTIKEAALLVESGAHKHLDVLIVVVAPEPVRIQRVMQRDGVEQSAVEARMRNQMPEADKVALADFTINNDGKHMLAPQVWQIHQKLLARINEATA